jgi:hypothetical protein
MIKTFSFSYEEYSSDTGALYETDEKMIVKLIVDNETCILSANREGLIALAKSLIKLADDTTPSGAHYHLDVPVFMEEGSAELIIDRI